MDDFNVSSLHESKNEWGARLLIILTPQITDGFKLIFDESYKLCKDTGELDKCLMTFQNFITRIPKWNGTIVETEKRRIVEKSGCSYLEELVTCIHIIQLKLLTAMRVGRKQKKIDINIPKLEDFIHQCYIHAARKIYKNVYLFERNCPPLQVQRHQRELELIIQECILNAVRESIPVESILKAYLDETVEEEVVEEIKEQVMEPPTTASASTSSSSASSASSLASSSASSASSSASGLSFNDVDAVMGKNGKEELVEAPKTIDRLEEISALRNMQRKMEEQKEKEEEEDKLIIGNEDIDLTLESVDLSKNEELVLDDIEILS